MKKQNKIALPVRSNKVQVTNMKTGESKCGTVFEWSTGSIKQSGFIRTVYVRFSAGDNRLLHCAPNLIWYNHSDCFPRVSPFFVHINHITSTAPKYKVELLTKKLTKGNYRDSDLVQLDPVKEVSTKSIIINKTQKESAMKTTKTSTSKKSTSSKVDAARAIFKRMFGKKNIARKDIIVAFMKEAKLSKAGASTYYQNISNEA